MNEDTPIKIKVCGMTKPEQVSQICELGIDAVGIILHANSIRKIDWKQAEEIRACIPASITMVAVCVNAPLDYVQASHERIGFDVVQLHGDEDEDYARQLSIAYIKAIRTKSAQYIQQQLKSFPSAQAFLLDTYVKGVAGGTGKTFASELWPQNSPHNLILSGGLNHENLPHLLKRYQPYAVDLNSGVESKPGVKDLKLLEQCVQEIRGYEQQLQKNDNAI